MAVLNDVGIVSRAEETGIVNVDGKPLTIHGTARVRAAVEAFSRYGKIVFSREQNFKRTLYWYHFIKPASKLRELYNLGDTVLILCCEGRFADLKSRTKDFVDYLVTAEFKNRLDKIIYFLIDEDGDIEQVVKNDRTENPDGRLIVPFSYAGLAMGLDDARLQDRLRTFLYERDLFGLASPLKDDTLSYGKDRSNAITELYGKYRQGEHGGLFGLRRIGKTSVLNLLRRRVEQDNGAVVYFDCTQCHHQRWNSFLHQIVQDIRKKYASSGPDAVDVCLPEEFSLPEKSSRYNEPKAAISFEEDLKSLYRGLGEKRILLIFDEIESISYDTSPSQHWREGSDALFFWQTIRAVFQKDSALFSFVIAGVNPSCVEEAKICGFDNPLFNGLTPQYISLFDLEDVRDMVGGIGGYLGLRFREEIFTNLIDDYGGHPFLIRQVCSQINSDVLGRREPRPYTVEKYSYVKHARDYQAGMGKSIEQILGVLQDHYPNEYDLLKTLALDGSAQFKKQLKLGENSIVHLMGYCLIEKAEDDYFIRIHAIEDYIKAKYPYEKRLSDPADKRNRVSARRNAIEVKLRELVAHQLVVKYGKKAREQLIARLRKSNDPGQEGRIRAAKDLDAAMEETYFDQIKGIVMDDWTDYEKVFNDRKKFEMWATVINQYRVDAHAKGLDEEDEAALHIAFSFFEKALADV